MYFQRNGTQSPSKSARTGSLPFKQPGSRLAVCNIRMTTSADETLTDGNCPIAGFPAKQVLRAPRLRVRFARHALDHQPALPLSQPGLCRQIG